MDHWDEEPETWRKLRDRMEKGIAIYDSVRPPDSILQFHEARYAGAVEFLEVVKSKNPNDEFNVYRPRHARICESHHPLQPRLSPPS